MQIRFHCPIESCVAIIEYEPLETCDEPIVCPRCRTPHQLNIDAAIRDRQTVERCPICRCEELFIRKDFPQTIGVLVVVIAAAISVFTLRTHWAVAYGALASAVVIDLLLYLVIGKVTTCYACRAEFRGGQINPAHEGFDLATSEKH